MNDLIFNFLCTSYVQVQDDRQRKMGLQYMTAETHELSDQLTDLYNRMQITNSEKAALQYIMRVAASKAVKSNIDPDIFSRAYSECENLRIKLGE